MMQCWPQGPHVSLGWNLGDRKVANHAANKGAEQDLLYLPCPLLTPPQIFQHYVR